ncbi:WYL domain-containing protein [Xanthomonas cerealis pv. cerealis]|uniref:WYL domain-containing protein n=1 Tax=Xanthomonas cerealis pv. cerealis TaxID=152263 RepID=A0A514EBL2_9XANT|nr:WYL domain-containing protein [Xanthomonas translucens]QDI03428.1 WYL domain-containing protein [Xanthomonas translucens pv. cerealis]
MATPAPNRTTDGQRIIEALLLWEGVARNDRLRDLLGVHYTSVSRQLAQYAGHRQTGLAYSMAHRAWLATPAFEPSSQAPSLEEYLALTGARGLISPALVRTHIDFGNTAPMMFATLHRACREGLAVSALHSSMRRPEPTHKIFFPHALVEAGRRWHVRAYIHETGRFQDLALTRLEDVQLHEKLERLPDAQRELDDAWNTIVDLRLIPHPDLTPAQKTLVRAEYFQRTMARTEPVRGALLPYVIQDLHAAIDPDQQRPPDYQLCVDDRDSIARWLMPEASTYEADT